MTTGSGRQRPAVTRARNARRTSHGHGATGVPPRRHGVSRWHADRRVPWHERIGNGRPSWPAVEPPSFCEGRLDLVAVRRRLPMTDARFVPATGSSASGSGSGPWLDAERLDVYRVALEFLALVPRLVPVRGAADLRDQLDRASSSIVLNIGEGAGRFSGPDKARFFAIARGSATECAAVLDVLRVRRLAPANDCLSARTLLVRIVQMLTKLAARHTA